MDIVVLALQILNPIGFSGIQLKIEMNLDMGKRKEYILLIIIQQ
jgi:hypothetical protein